MDSYLYFGRLVYILSYLFNNFFYIYITFCSSFGKLPYDYLKYLCMYILIYHDIS